MRSQCDSLRSTCSSALKSPRRHRSYSCHACIGCSSLWIRIKFLCLSLPTITHLYGAGANLRGNLAHNATLFLIVSLDPTPQNTAAIPLDGNDSHHLHTPSRMPTAPSTHERALKEQLTTPQAPCPRQGTALRRSRLPAPWTRRSRQARGPQRPPRRGRSSAARSQARGRG